MSEEINNELIKRIAERPIFIFGHGKSGTTLLAALLSDHPELVVFPLETYFVGRFVHKTQELSNEQKLEHAIRLLGVYHNHYSGLLADISLDTLVESFKRYLFITERHDRDYLAAIVLAYGHLVGALNSGTQAWVEKTPEYEKYGKYIYSQWPQAMCIHIIRDPRDNYNSYRRTRNKHWPHKKQVTASWFARRWRLSIHFAEENQKLFGKQKYKIVRYEDLVQNPRRQLPHIADFLGIADHSTLYIPTLAGKSWAGNSSYGSHFTQISNDSIGRWQEHLEFVTAAWLEALLAQDMERYGYASSSDTTLGRKLVARFWRYYDMLITIKHKVTK